MRKNVNKKECKTTPATPRPGFKLKSSIPRPHGGWGPLWGLRWMKTLQEIQNFKNLVTLTLLALVRFQSWLLWSASIRGNFAPGIWNNPLIWPLSSWEMVTEKLPSMNTDYFPLFLELWKCTFTLTKLQLLFVFYGKIPFWYTYLCECTFLNANSSLSHAIAFFGIQSLKSKDILGIWNF